ncbi:hypothetical protein [Catelliglobosispora koreensis]|uniref:hypothetical protein n=1 Tax=Catelliglobosispora koreensis TaxID=129052 RepID=UPI00037C09ED|nr:hypothetical protein [Catelliglobosispora koreensis]
MSRYPLDRHVADSRFSFGVTAEVAKVLARFGYPNIMSFYDGAPADADRLQAALLRFIYGPADACEPAAMALPEWMAQATSELVADSGPAPLRPVGAPVEFRLISNPTAATHAADILHHVFNVTYVSDPHPGRDGRVRIYLTGHRAAPYKGGIK